MTTTALSLFRRAQSSTKVWLVISKTLFTVMVCPAQMVPLPPRLNASRMHGAHFHCSHMVGAAQRFEPKTESHGSSFAHLDLLDLDHVEMQEAQMLLALHWFLRWSLPGLVLVVYANETMVHGATTSTTMLPSFMMDTRSLRVCQICDHERHLRAQTVIFESIDGSLSFCVIGRGTLEQIVVTCERNKRFTIAWQEASRLLALERDFTYCQRSLGQRFTFASRTAESTRKLLEFCSSCKWSYTCSCWKLDLFASSDDCIPESVTRKLRLPRESGQTKLLFQNVLHRKKSTLHYR
jgi:hypothetical protein